MFFQEYWGFDPLNYPELRIDTQGYGTDLYVYAGFIWPMFLVEWTENNDVVKSIWERMGENLGKNIMEDIDFILLQYNKSLNEALNEYAVWRYYTGSRADQNNLKCLFPTAKTKNNNSYPTGSKLFDSMGGLGGVNFVVFTGNYDVLNVFMNGADIIQWGALYLNDNGYNNFTKNIFPLNSNGDGSLEIIKRDINNVVLIPVCPTPTKGGGNGFYSATIPAKRVVKFTNRYIQENLGGQLLLNNNDDINSGDLRILGYNTYPVKTKNERFSDSNIKKHNNFFLSRDFTVKAEGDVDQNAQFNNLLSATVRNVIDGMSFNDGIPISFNDPWYVKDEYDTQSDIGDFLPFPSPYYPTGKYSETTGGVFLNQSGPPLWTPPYYSVKANAMQDILLTNTGAPAGRYHKFIFRNWSAEPLGSAEFQYANSSATPVVFKSEDATVQANLKGTQLSSQQDGFNSNSQRKAVRLYNSNLISIYKSLGKVWIEKSTNSGQSWSLWNLGTPFYDGFDHFTPAIDDIPWNETHSFAAVVYSNGSDIQLNVIRTNYPGSYFSQGYEVNWGDNLYLPVTPVIAVTSNRILIISNGGKNQSGQEGLIFLYGTISYSAPGPVVVTLTDGHLSPLYKIIPGTNYTSINPTIVADKNSPTPLFHIAWQQSDGIKYCRLTELNGIPLFSTVETPSANSGCTNHYNPSISLANGYPVLSWTGKSEPGIWKIMAKDDLIRKTDQKAIIRRGPVWGDFQIVGSKVNFTNNNSVTSALEKTVITWSEGTTPPQSKWIKRTGASYSIPRNLSHSGIQSQVISGSDYQYMTSIVFNNNQVPYYFINTTTDFSYVGSSGGGGSTDTSFTFGRAGIVNIKNVEFVFNLGDVIVNNNPIRFLEKPDTLVCTGYSDLNQYTRTDNFQLNNKSDFYFSNWYYVLNKELAETEMDENHSVDFKVELVNAKNKLVIGTFDNITYNKYNLETHDNIYYRVNCSGIKPGDYYLRLVTTVNTAAKYSLANIVNVESELEKSGYTEVGYTGELLPDSYDLAQNYPNPFNPSTIIKYQIPQDGLITLKVYDILGREVTTLVNEQKTAGRYEATFNAGHLASGVYIYKLQSGDYNNSKKMLLVK